MKRRKWTVVVLSAFLLTGCATTGRNYQTDIDALNARVSALQGQLAEKDQQLSKLQDDLNEQRSAREATEGENRSLETQLRDARTQKTAPAQSDLK